MDVSQFHTGTLYGSSEKNPQAQNLKLEFNDTLKTNNSSSQEANDLLYRLEQTVDLHSVQLYTKSRDASDHIAGYVAFKAAKYYKDYCFNCLGSYAPAHAHGDSYVNPLTPRRTLVDWPLSPKFQFYFKKGSSKKFPMSVAPMSR